MSSQRSACHHRGASRALAPRDVGDRGLKGGLLCWCGASCPGKGLAGAAEAVPGKGLAGGACFALLSFVFWSWRCLGCLVLRLLSGSPPLPCLVWLRRVALTAHAQVKGYKGVPLLLYTDRSPRAWATHKRDTLLGQAQNSARAVEVNFYRGHCSARCASPRPALNARRGGSCVTWGSCVGWFPHACVTSW